MQTPDSVLSKIAAYILANPLRPLVEHQTSYLESKTRAEGAKDYLNVDFGSCGTEAHLSVHTEPLGSPEDSDGNTVLRTKLFFSFNHPTHGSTDLSTTIQRLTFLREAASYFAEIENRFGYDFSGGAANGTPIVFTKVVQTKAEREAREVANQIQYRLFSLYAATTNVRKGMRVGNTRPYDGASACAILGSDTVGLTAADGKVFNVSPTHITRIALALRR